MLTVEQATACIWEHLPDWGSTTLALDTGVTGTLASPVVTDRPYPPLDRVMMDGIALVWSRYQGGQRVFPITGTAIAGHPPVVLADPQACIEVMTGAPLPQGCDLVIPYEYLDINGSVATIVRPQDWPPYAHVDRQGSSAPAQQEVLAPGHRLKPPDWGIVASLGYTRVNVQRFPRTLIISTGDELVAPDVSPQPYQLRQSNPYALRAALRQHGYPDVDVLVLPDDENKLRAVYEQASQDYDQLIYTGGISQGKRDLLPKLWREMGVTCYVQGVRQRPGKPLWFGVDHQRQTVVFGLPGNPVASLVCLYRYVLQLTPRYGKLTEPVVFTPPLTYFLPVRVHYSPQADIWVTPQPVKNSGDFLGLAGTDGFIELPAERSEFGVGECFPLYGW
ncbi:MAG: molybdopterin molybdotransferase MoeA [Gloeomargarita sp. SKYG116]|nr:molybdopterin molybdotransferase MoeA [Gloeomargarita sp. SKYG116]MDW8401921.1 molybdopterin molybdotransferase MoeA [Gloeomargarita sp. SKYGB_i_bin116]